MVVLGGGHHHEGETVNETWMRGRYDRIDPSDYRGFLSDEDFDYIWYWFEQVRDFYRGQPPPTAPSSSPSISSTRPTSRSRTTRWAPGPDILIWPRSGR
jgi:hypothetical protein